MLKWVWPGQKRRNVAFAAKVGDQKGSDEEGWAEDVRITESEFGDIW